MKKYLISENGNFYKANMHCHSTWSDGTYSPEELKKLYKEQGYSVLSITDHNGLFNHYELDDEDFITITGYEWQFDETHGPDYADCITTHICAYAKDKENYRQPGFNPELRFAKMRWTVNDELRALARPMDDTPFAKTREPAKVNDAIKRLPEDGLSVTYNHPAWAQEDYETYMNYTEVDNLEIYNHGCFLAGYDEHNGKEYDHMLRKNIRVKCVCADDNHRTHDMFGGFTMFKAEKLEYSYIMDAFEKGNFYSSTGPEITKLYIEDGKVYIETKEPVDFFRMLTGRRTASFVKAADGKINSASFNIDKNGTFFRIEAVDGYKTAYTNAYFIDEIFDDE